MPGESDYRNAAVRNSRSIQQQKSRYQKLEIQMDDNGVNQDLSGSSA